MKRLIFAACVLLSAAAHADTLYTTNFDSATPGVIAPSWTAVVGTWAVGTTNPVSSPNSFGSTSHGDHDIAVYTGHAAIADMDVVFTQKLVDQSSGTNTLGCTLRSDGTGANEYAILLAAQSGGLNLLSVKVVGGSLSVLDTQTAALATATTGHTIGMRCEAQGSTIRARVWDATASSEPSSWRTSFSDGSITAAGYGGVFQGGTATIAFDDFTLSDFNTTTAAVTVTATNEIMHAGQAFGVPPLTWRVTGGAGCTGTPALSTTATTGSAAGDYPITAAQGSFSCTGSASYSFVAGNMKVLPALDVPVFGVPNQDRSGALLTLNTPKPSGFMTTVQQWATTVGCTITSDGTGDDSACINSILHYQRAQGNDYYEVHRGIFFLPGTYAICAQALSEWGNALTLRGAGVGQSTLKVLPNCSTYATSNTPVFHSDSFGGNSTFRNYIADLTIEVAPGNPHALGLVFSANNSGGLDNVRLVCDDGTCPLGLGLDLTAAGLSGDTGPMLLKNIEVINFAKCFDLGNAGQFGITAENITGMGCNDSGYTAIDQHPWVRHALLYLAGGAPGVNSGANNAVLLGSNIIAGSGGSGTYCFYEHDGGTIVMEDTLCSGFGTPLNDNGTIIASPITAHYSGTAGTLFSGAKPAGMLHLPFKETPVASDPDISTWVALGNDLSTWNTTVNSGASTFYAPFGLYQTGPGVTYDVNIPCTANHIMVNDTTPGIPGHGGETVVRFNVTATCPAGTPPVVLEYLGSYNFVNTCGNRDTVVRHGQPTLYTNCATGTRTTYWEDIQPLQGNPASFYAGQEFYGRQVDVEQLTYSPGGASIPHIVFDGTGGLGLKARILGLKTEQPGSVTGSNLGEVLTVLNGARVEVDGAFFFAVNCPVPGAAAIGVYNADLSLTGFQYNTGGNPCTWDHFVRAQSGATTSTFTPFAANSNGNQGLFYDLLTPLLNLPPLVRSGNFRYSGAIR